METTTTACVFRILYFCLELNECLITAENCMTEVDIAMYVEYLFKLPHKQCL